MSQTSPASTVRQRAPRSTGGCATCKKRKVKCDETRPCCEKCRSRGVQCPGYQTAGLRWSSKHEIISRPDAASAKRPKLTHHHADAPGPRDKRPTPSSQPQDPIGKPSTGSIEPSIWDSTTVFSTQPAPTPSQDLDVSSDCWPPTTGTQPLQVFSSLASHEQPADRRGSSRSNSAALSPGRPEVKDDQASQTTFECAQLARDSISAAERHLNKLPLLIDDESGPFQLPDGSTDLSLDLALSDSNVDTTTTSDNTAMVPTFRNASYTYDPSPGPSLLHIPTLLVDYYFHRVCRDCSMFDSTLNPFRSMVADMRRRSASIDYAIQSLAASKLADDMPCMRLTGIEAQGKALEMLTNECLSTNSLHEVSDEVLCTMLLLGMTTSWHVRTDLGLEYIAQARRIVSAREQSADPAAKSNIRFFRHALHYWTMIIRLVTDADDDDQALALATIGPEPALTPASKIMPHPWTGVSPVPLQLFGQVMQLVRKTRPARNGKCGLEWNRASINHITNAISTAEKIEIECWAVLLPAVSSLEDTKDSDTPALHHVLTATIYVLATLLHIYMVFPDVLDNRISAVSPPDRPDTSPSSDEPFAGTPVLSWEYLWPRRSPHDERHLWLADIGIRITECLAAIDVRSSTRVVHPPILLCVSSALVFSPLTGPDDTTLTTLPHRNMGMIPGVPYVQAINKCVGRCRTFITNRLETMHAAMRFHAIDNILKVNKTVWQRSDAGSPNVFWMDVMYELGCETLFG